MSNPRRLYLLLALVLLCQLISMWFMPYADNSEPRYAEIARLMVITNDWLTPWFEPSVPFWGKPPLSFWLQALSIKLFGTSEISARLPAWLSHLLITYLIIIGTQSYYKTQKKTAAELGLLAALIYNSCTLSFVASSAVLTDIYLSLGTTLAFVSILIFSRTEKRKWAYGFFIALSIGALAKGPLALIFIITPLLIASFASDSLIRIKLKQLPWGTGILLFLILTLPWYIAAELKTPGFLRYFIVGEHLQRFLDSGWQGDLYGSAHQKPRGSIWWLWLQSTFPWGLIAIAALLTALIKKSFSSAILHRSLMLYMVTAALISPVFFTFAGNILWTYNLPSIAPFALLMAPLVYNYTLKSPYKSLLPITVLAVPLVGVTLSLFVYINPHYINTEKQLIHYFEKSTPSQTHLYYLDRAPFSARYYSHGTVQIISQSELLASTSSPNYLAIPLKQLNELKPKLAAPYQVIFTNKRYALLHASFTD